MMRSREDTRNIQATACLPVTGRFGYDMRTRMQEDRQDERWIESLRELAAARNDAPAIVQRAEELVRQLKLSLWIALGVAERLIPLADAEGLDRAARCKQLRDAVLVERRPLSELRVHFPWAPYMLASDLWPRVRAAGWTMHDLTDACRSMLRSEVTSREDGSPTPMRVKSLDEYQRLLGQIQQRRRQDRHGTTSAAEAVIENRPLIARPSERPRMASYRPRSDGPPSSYARPSYGRKTNSERTPNT